MRNRKAFTLIELLVVVVIISVIAAFAIPSYQNYIVRTKRAAAMAALVQAGQALERYKSANNGRYTGATLGSGGIFADQVPVEGGKPDYTLSLRVTPTSWTLTATPVSGGTQAGDGALTYDNAGNKTWNGKNCWPQSGNSC